MHKKSCPYTCTTGELGYDRPLYDRFLHMTDDMLGPSPMHIKYLSYVNDRFCIYDGLTFLVPLSLSYPSSPVYIYVMCVSRKMTTRSVPSLRLFNKDSQIVNQLKQKTHAPYLPITYIISTLHLTFYFRYTCKLNHLTKEHCYYHQSVIHTS